MLRTVTSVERYQRYKIVQSNKMSALYVDFLPEDRRRRISRYILRRCYAMSAPGKSVVHGIFMSGCVILGMKMCQNMRGRKLYNERKEKSIFKYADASLHPDLRYCDGICVR